MTIDGKNYREGNRLNSPLDEIEALSTEIYGSIEALEKELKEKKIQAFVDYLYRELNG
jgi:hypothetical protein